MIHHHSQAVEMVDLLRTRGLSKDLLAFGERIAISQIDEIKSMRMWLEDFGPACRGVRACTIVKSRRAFP